MKLSPAIFLPAVFLVLWSGGSGLYAQVPGNLDPAYQPPVLDQGAQAVVIQPDRKALLGGAFTTFNGAAVSPLIRLNADGTLDTSFASSAGILVPGENADVNALVIQSDGTIVAAAFGTTDNQATLTRLKVDGTLDPSFTVTLPNGGVTTMGLQANPTTGATSRIVIGGTFTTVDTTNISALASLNLDGTINSSFVQQPMLDNPAVNLIAQVTALVIQPDEKIVVVGTINTDAGPASGLVRLNGIGNLDVFFNPVILSSGSFQSVALQPDGSIIASGSFTSVNGVTVPNIARFSGVDGTLDQSFAAGTGFTAGFNRMAVQADGKILCANTTASSTTLVRLNADGSVDRDFTPGFLVATSAVTALALQPDGLSVVSGTLVPPNASASQPSVSVVRLLASAPAVSATTVTVTVPATANPWLAPLGATDPKDSVPAEAPTRVTGLALTPGSTLSFSATGLVSIFQGNPADTAPDGLAGTFPTHPAENGLSGVTSNYNSLVGVFINDSPLDANAAGAPADLDFSNPTSVPGGLDYTALQPALGQVFFIGDGVTSGGVTQHVTVPAGATHLALGTIDTDTYSDNNGAFTVTVTANPAVSTPLTATTLTVDGSSNSSLVPKGEAITFVATQGAVGPGIYVKVQATMTPNVDSSWTDLADTTNGGPGYLAGDGSGNYTLKTTQYPFGQGIFFRAVAIEGATMSTSNNVGDFDLASADAPNLFITETGITADDPAAAVAIVGDQITYTLKVYNDGPQTSNDVRVIFEVPTDQQLVSVDESYVSNSPGQFVIDLGALNPTGNSPVLLHIVTTVTSDAHLGQVFTGLGYSVSGTDGAFAQGTDTVTTTVVPPLEVVVTSNSTTVSPGQALLLRVYVHNRTAATVKNVALSIPLPAAVNYGFATLTDSKGLLVAGPTKGGKPVYPVNPLLTSTNVVMAYLGNVAADARDTVSLDLTIPYDVDPAAAITFDALQVTSKSFTLPDTTVALSGVSPATTPQISFSKILVDLPSVLQLAVTQPKLAKDFKKVLATIAADSAQLAVFATVYPKLAALAADPAAVKGLTYAQFATALNPDLGYTSSLVSGQSTIPTIPEPAVAKDVPYLAFALTYTNTGGASVPNVTIRDLVPAGTSILDAKGNYNGSVIINGKPGNPGGNMTISKDGRTLIFNIGTLAASQTTVGFIIYKVRLLGAGEPGAFSDGNLISSSGSLLSSPDLSTEHIGQPDGEDIEVVGKYDYYLESTQPTSNSTTLAEGITYDIYYVNTGRASAVLEIDDPIPAGLQYLGCELLDADHKSYDVPADAVEAPAPAAGQQYPTSGTVVFHPPLFSGSGLIAAKASGYIREYFYPLPTALASGITGFLHAPVVAQSSYGNTRRFGGGQGTPRAIGRGPVTRATDAGATAGGTSYTQVDDPSLPKVFVATAVPMTMVEGVTSEIYLVEGCLNDTIPFDGFINVLLPPALQYISTAANTAVGVGEKTDSAGNTLIQIDFAPANGGSYKLQPHSANFVKIRVQPKAGTASATPLVLPNCYFLSGYQSLPPIQTGPVTTTIQTAAQANALSALKAQVAGNALTAVGTTSPALSEFVDHIGKASRTIAVAGASGLSCTNGVLIVPLLGSPAQTLAMGPSSALIGDGTVKQLYTESQDFLVESGPSTGIVPGPFTGANGASIPAQTASQLMSDLGNNAPGNLVKTGVALIANVGGNNLISQDGSSLISQDGGGAVAKASDLISQDGGGLLAAGRSNTDGLISQDGGGLIGQDGGGLISQDGGGLISQDGSSIIATKGGSVVAANGGNLISQDGSTLMGSSDNSQFIHATASGNLIQLGSSAGAIGENSSGFTGTQSAIPITGTGKKKR